MRRKALIAGVFAGMLLVNGCTKSEKDGVKKLIDDCVELADDGATQGEIEKFIEDAVGLLTVDESSIIKIKKIVEAAINDTERFCC